MRQRGQHAPKFSPGANSAAEAENFLLEMSLVPLKQKPHCSGGNQTLKGICDNLACAPHILCPFLSFRSILHLSPFRSISLAFPLYAGTRPLCSTGDHRAGASTPSAATAAPDLLPRLPLPPHRSCFPICHYRHTRAASPSATTAAPELLPLQLLPPHGICFPVHNYRRTGAASTSTTPVNVDDDRNIVAAAPSSTRSYPDESQWSKPEAKQQERGAWLGGGNDEREQTINQLLTELDGFAGNSIVIVLALTIRPEMLDFAFLRPERFDRQVTFDWPDVAGCVKILEVIEEPAAPNL
ncbi:hypothetical protein C2845_PM03G31830 [Panicum miliaceum]|uniref:ATPase AAA-type core domain-containing protein n=1 Tax=Panicum miliaceum TaxID=4540 RepID=A0A3L6TA13_PANMI|nr:hypothetical protein C2845_PM03G31830 [Panicum miliaceum]